MPKNAVVAQSGGPTAVINNSVRGAIDVFMESNEVDKVYGAQMGILGVLRNELIDISAQHPKEVSRLQATPSAGAIGSCRYKLADKASGQPYQEDYERIIDVFRAHDVGYFLYAGGNDSMDTANRINQLAQEKGLDLKANGIVKTVDNDVGGDLQDDGTFAICDHDPGYGSTARFWATNVLEANEENKASYTSDPVLVLQAMGRKVGFITASAKLADPEGNMPLLIVVPEALGDDPQENLDFITDRVNATLKQAGRCIVVLTEGANLGDVGVLRDSFGHAQFSASRRFAGQLLINHLNGIDRTDSQGRAQSRLCVPGIARLDVPGTRQRRDSSTISTTDVSEAYEVGGHSAKLALGGEGGVMGTIVRQPGDGYSVTYDKVELEKVANAERKFPEEWIVSGELDITQDYVKWARPLIGGDLPRFTRFEPRYADDAGLGEYTPEAYR